MPQEADGGLPPIDTATRPIGDVVGVAIHHTPTYEPNSDPVDAAQQIDDYHRRKGWAGAGYHRLAAGGLSVVMRTIEQVGAHEEGENRTWLAIAVVGPGGEASQQTIDTAGWQLAALEDRLGKRLKVAGHGDLPGANTGCPGDPNLPAKVRAAADAYHEGVKSEPSNDDDSEEWNMEGMIVCYGSRGTPDSESAAAVAGTIGAWATNSPSKATEALQRGATVIAVGGPGSRELKGADNGGRGKLIEANGGSALASLQEAADQAHQLL